MSHVQTGITAHDNAVAKSEGMRQTSVVGASASAARTAEILHYRTALASAIANNCAVGPFLAALRELGVSGL